MSDVVVFAPSPVLTVTVEDRGGQPDIHLHAGGQGVWQARMLVTLGAQVTMCAVLAGETGRVLRPLIEADGVTVHDVAGSGHNGAYVHDRRGDDRVVIAESEPDPLSRHELDMLYDVTLAAGLDAGAAILSGTSTEGTVPADVYRRLAADLRATGRHVVADLTGERLKAVLDGGVTVLKISDDELSAEERAVSTDLDSLVVAMHQLREEGADYVVVTRAAEPALVLANSTVSVVTMPRLQAVETRGAGDSFTAGTAITLAEGGDIHDAVRLGAAAGAVNITRHGLGTGDIGAVQKLRELVEVKPLDHPARGEGRVSPDDLARRVRET